MRRIRRVAEKAWTAYGMLGFWGFVEHASIYLLRRYPILPVARRMRFHVLPRSKGIKSYKREAVGGQTKVLYGDTISEPRAKSAIYGMIKAYCKVSTLMTFDYWKLTRQHGQFRMNEMLVKTAVDFKPDLIHLGKSELIHGSTIKKIKQEINTCVIHFCGNFQGEIQPWVTDIGKYADCTLFCHKDTSLVKQYEDLGVRNKGFWWVGADPDIFHPRGGDKIYDVVFVGNNSDFLEGHKLRRELIAATAKRGIEIHIFGNDWEYLSGVPNVCIHPFVTEEEFAKVCSASKITLGINAVNNVRMYTSWHRTFNSMASGAFHLTHYVPDLEDVFKNRKHLVWFNSIPEAVKLMEYYLAHDEEREKIAHAGRQEVLVRHTWDLRIAETIERVAKYQVRSGLRPPQGMNSKVTPVIAIHDDDKSAPKTTLRPVKYNLNFDDLLPCYTDFTLLERLVQLFPEIKVTIFMPINSRVWGNKNILDYPRWCQKIAQLPSKNFEIAPHGYYHHLNDRVRTPEFKYLSKKEAANLLLRCEEAFKRAGIKFIRGFRPPRWEMSKGTEQALEKLGYLFLSDSPRFYEEHQNIKIPRIFANSDIKENEEHIYEVKPYRHLLLDLREFYIHRGHLVSHCDNNLTKDTFDNIVRTVMSFENIEFKFLSEIAEEMRE